MWFLGNLAPQSLKTSDKARLLGYINMEVPNFELIDGKNKPLANHEDGPQVVDDHRRYGYDDTDAKAQDDKPEYLELVDEDNAYYSYADDMPTRGKGTFMSRYINTKTTAENQKPLYLEIIDEANPDYSGPRNASDLKPIS